MQEKNWKSTSDYDSNLDSGDNKKLLIPPIKKALVKPKDVSSGSYSSSDSDEPAPVKASVFDKKPAKTVRVVKPKNNSSSHTDSSSDDNWPLAKKTAIASNPSTVKNKGKETSSDTSSDENETKRKRSLLQSWLSRNLPRHHRPILDRMLKWQHILFRLKSQNIKQIRALMTLHMH